MVEVSHAPNAPSLLHSILREPDAVSHDFGPVSMETEKMVMRLDSLLGVLRNKIILSSICTKNYAYSCVGPRNGADFS